ncbi:holo-[acyl-carrier-protein] synthase [Spiroplasma clarkii]|uniref:Holo-[acyl-carrier-protein] synthase n=1 Tax=Spiroplasma clarkii TaxID=2139 RepID=A0A1Y0L159_9MOLU|nr:4'-phosphopantetheinyl transferase superfamily protein [Spiroplasma clarkii]ARU91429.1 holo-[acyl-carrier-protein] synthase [Spiroplasma clarkii]ATX70844.1 holo-[acyl-carrier-protein] synthase [Spiroplasma clarkii]
MNKIGLDIVQVERIKLSEALIAQILHVDEYKYLTKIEDEAAKKQFLAGRWAAKEAIIKVIDDKITPKHICIDYLQAKPVVTKPSKLAHLELSIAHEKDYAVAVVLNL